MQSLTSANSTTSNTNSEGSAASALNFFQSGASRRSSENDIGTMDDVQFNEAGNEITMRMRPGTMDD